MLAALILMIFGVEDAEATEEDDLYLSAEGDNDYTSYSSQYGEAYFTIIISTGPVDHSNVSLSVDADDDAGWSNEQVTIYDVNDDTCSQGGETADETIDLGDIPGDSTVEVCMKISSSDASPELGDEATFELVITSNECEDECGSNSVRNVYLKISNWFAYSEDDAKEFEIDTAHAYTITVKNLKVNEDGEEVAIDDPVTIALATIGFGWNIDSEDSSWDPMEMMATINYIEAGDSYDLVLNIQLIDSIVPASSYVGNSHFVFLVNDGTVYALVSLEAIVADYFEPESTGSGNIDVDNGCESTEEAVGWTTVIKNFGNTIDSFSVNFDTSDADAVGWTVDGADSFNTGNLNPKFEIDEETGTGIHTINLGLHIPSGLPAGTSHGFTMTVTSGNDSAATQSKEFSATVIQCFGIAVTVDKTTDSANPGASADFTISVTNVGNGDDTVSLESMGASEWSPTLAESELTIASGATSTTLLSITVPSDASANAQSGMVMVHAYSEACGNDKQDCDYKGQISVSLRASQVYDITAGYYSNETDVVKDTASVQEGISIQMKFTLTNNGNGNDEVTLSLVNAPEWITLGQTNALVGPGQTMILTIDVQQPSSDARGDHTFQITATSADGTTSSTTGDLTVTVTEKVSNTGGPTTEEVPGCMNPTAKNYNESVNVDDGSCVFYIYGCMNSTAINYISWAEVDGECLFGPIAIAGQNATSTPGVSVQFSGAGTDEDGTVEKYEWDFDGDGIFEWSSFENGLNTYIYNNEGTYTATLRVTDNDGFTDTDSLTVTVKSLDNEDDEGIPSISLITSLILIGLLAIFRRK